MPPKTPRPGWKTGEQLEFLLSRYASFKSAQNNKTLGRFWQRVFEDWYLRWKLPSAPYPDLLLKYGTLEEARFMIQKSKNAKIKHWFNNRGRGSDAAGGGRGSLKLDASEKKKLAPVQAYCSYAWKTSLRQIVLESWEEHKAEDTFDDDDDPPEDATGLSAIIPLAFKLKIAKREYEKLSDDEKLAIDHRREEDKKKPHRKIPQIDDEDERIEKLLIHQRNQSVVRKSLTRALANLEDQAGCVTQVLVAYVNPAGGAPLVQKYCQGETVHGLDFETFYGDEWNRNVEKRFREWSLRVFGERGSDRRSMFLLGDAGAQSTSGVSPSEPETTPEDLSAESQMTPEDPSAESQITPTATSSEDMSTKAQKSASTLSQSLESVPQPSSTPPFSEHVSTPQVAATSSPPQSRPTPTLIIPASQTSIDPPLPFADPPSEEDMLLVATAIGVHQLLSHAAPVVQPPAVAAENLDIQPPQLSISPSQLIIEPQVVVGPPQPAGTAVGVHQLLSQAATVPLVVQPPPMAAPETPNIQTPQPPSQLAVEHQVVVGPLQSAPGRSHTSAEVSVDPRVNSTIAPTSFQSPPVGVGTAPSVPTPKSQYRVRDPAVAPSEKPRRNSIDGAPEMIVDLINGEEEVIVDISDYISIASDDDESHVSSSQRTADECQELPPPPPDSQQAQVGVGSHSTRTLPQINIDGGDLPTWMVKKGQWMYLASTAGGAAWEALLKVYMSQERRLEFTEMGAVLPTEDRPTVVKDYFRYAHQPSRGDSLTIPSFGAEVAKWWERIQPEWRRTTTDLPQSPDQWSFILSGGSKGAFILILCLAWWSRAHGRYLEERKTRQANVEAAGATGNLDDLPDHDGEWLKIVNDVAFVMRKAQESQVPGRGTSSSSQAKRKREMEPPTPRKKPAASRTRSRT